MSEHAYNGLLRTYAGAAAVRQVKEEHIDLYIKDAWELFEQIKGNPKVSVNIHILNSILLIHTNALRVEDLDSTVLPIYAKFKIKHDVYTYQHLSKMYLNLTEYQMVKNMYKKLKSEKLTPNQMYLNSVLEAGMRTDDADTIFDAL